MLKQFDLLILNEYFRMKILRSTRKFALAGKAGAGTGEVLPYYFYYAAAAGTSTSSRRLCHLLQLMSVFIICCTLIVYQVTVPSDSENSSSRNSISSSESGSNSIPYTYGDENGNDIRLIDDILLDQNQERGDNDNNIENGAPVIDGGEVPLESNFGTLAEVAEARKVSASQALSTSSPTSEDLNNVFLSVKSTKRFHSSRLEPILQTWFNLAKDQVRANIF
jgi:hypothetical protein